MVFATAKIAHPIYYITILIMRKYRKKRMKRERIPVLIYQPSKDRDDMDQPMFKATVDYKNLLLLRQFISSQGKILPRRLTRLTAKEQRNMANAIKTARVIGFLPFINK